MNLNRKVLIVTDEGVPKEYAEIVASQCKEGFIETVPQGEESKSIEVYEKLLKKCFSTALHARMRLLQSAAESAEIWQALWHQALCVV